MKQFHFCFFRFLFISVTQKSISISHSILRFFTNEPSKSDIDMSAVDVVDAVVVCELTDVWLFKLR